MAPAPHAVAAANESQAAATLGSKPSTSARPLPFQSIIATAPDTHGVFEIGKKKKRTLHLTERTKLWHGDGTTPATAADLLVGVEIRGSLRRLDNGEYEALSLKIGPKP